MENKAYITAEVKELFNIAEEIAKQNSRIIKLHLSEDNEFEISKAINKAMREVLRTAAEIVGDNMAC